MNPAEKLEQACADAWPAQVERRLGDWRLRAAGGFTGRANSALALGDPGRPVPDALSEICEFAHAHRIEPMAQAVRGGPVEDALARAGWVPHETYVNGHEVSVLLGPLRPGARGTGEDGVRVLGAPTPGWWELTVDRPEPTEAERHVLTGGARVGYGVATREGRTVGAVRGAVAGGVLLVARLAVRPEYRGQGLGTALMAAVGGWAGRHGATRCALQVSVRNERALALYERLGFGEHHRYRYWVPGAR
ncbi:GNAT family N-acetyltransferase [Prauserella shujinwangii]|uniref:GNAT family N-acetyltransferase n=1 Tax=Prauserella shujinwangii TaxID=1453103 RepID=UPI000D081249|nr:GNAT family N-acetyltransferase [Prauserella shujinwangii]